MWEGDCGHAGNAPGKTIDIEIGVGLVGSGELIDFTTETIILDFVIAEEGHGMHPDVIGDDTFNLRHSKTSVGKLPPLEGLGGAADGDAPADTGLEKVIGIDHRTERREVVTIDDPSLRSGAIEGDFLEGFELVGGMSGAENGGDFEFPTESGRLTDSPTEIGDETGGLFEKRKPGVIDLAGHEDASGAE